MGVWVRCGFAWVGLVFFSGLPRFFLRIGSGWSGFRVASVVRRVLQAPMYDPPSLGHSDGFSGCFVGVVGFSGSGGVRRCTISYFYILFCEVRFKKVLTIRMNSLFLYPQLLISYN